jgi:hypothetical protein
MILRVIAVIRIREHRQWQRIKQMAMRNFHSLNSWVVEENLLQNLLSKIGFVK